MGGGPMRTAAGVAGVAVANVGLRGVISEYNSISSFTRGQAPKKPAAADNVNSATSQSHTGVQIVSSNIDDAKAKVVSAGIPTPQEATEAIAELSLALKALCQSSTKSVGCEGSFADDPNFTRITSAFAATPLNALNAFYFFCESSMAQKVVASITCDQNVWDAVINNADLRAFLHSEKKNLSRKNTNQSSMRHSDIASSFAQESEPDIQLVGFVDRVKFLVFDVMNTFSGYFRQLLGNTEANGVVERTSNADTVMEIYFMGLSVMAIMVILLKRV